MKQLPFLFYFLISLASIGQQWSQLSNTGIYKLSIAVDSCTYFKKDSSIIAVSERFQKDFTQLFIDSKEAFDSIFNNCSKISAFMFSDSLKNYYEKFNSHQVVYFIQRKIEKEDNILSWGMTNLYGQGQPCWPIIRLKRIRVNNIWKLLFLSIETGFCEI